MNRSLPFMLATMLLTMLGVVAFVSGCKGGGAPTAGLPYAGKGADLIYGLMPSLRKMRVADTMYSEQPAGSRFAGRWHASVAYCTTMSVDEAQITMRSDLEGKGFSELRDNYGDLFFSCNHPPMGYHYASVKVLEDRNARGPEDKRVGAEKTMLEVTVAFYP